MGSRKSGNRRPVYVNGEYCESMTAGARELAKISGMEIRAWHMQRMLGGELEIEGIAISEKPPVTRNKPVVVQALKSAGGPLLRYPHGEHPLDRGLPRAWR